MKAVLSLILKYIRRNKKRSLFLGISIMISAALITSLTFTIEDFKREKEREILEITGGDFDLQITTSNNELLKDIDNFSFIKDKSDTIILSEHIKLNEKNGIQLVGIDNRGPDIFKFTLVDGKYPSSDNEIALDSWMINNLNPVPKIGDKINLTYEIKEGEKLKGQNKDKLDIAKINEKFILVGTFEQIPKNENYAVGYVTKHYAENMLIAKGDYKKEDILHLIYIKVKENTNIKDTKELFLQYNSFANDNYIRQLLLKGLKTWDKIGFILYFILTITSTVIIYNMFNGSTMLRTQEIGMFKALGMTPKQVKWLIIGEGILLGVIFIFLGILLGGFFYKFSLSIISGTTFKYALSDIPSKAIKMSYIFGILSVIIGSIASANKISKMSSIDALNCVNYLDIESIRFKDNEEIGGTTQKFLWDISLCNIKRNKGRFIITTTSIIISVVLFMFINYIMNSQDPSYGFKESFGADFKIETTNLKYNPIKDQQIDSLKNICGEDSINESIRNSGWIYLTESRDKITKECIEDFQDKANRFDFYKEANKKGQIYNTVTELGYSRRELEKLRSEIKEGKIDLDLMEKEPICILVQNLMYNNFTNFKVGDKITISKGVYSNSINDNAKLEVTIGAILNNKEYIPKDNSIYTEVIMSDTMLKKYLDIDGYSTVEINLDNKDGYMEVKKDIINNIKNDRTLILKDYKEELAKTKEQYFKVGIFFYSFIIITSLSSITNIFGIMRTSMALRKKEFAVFRAVGMSNSELKKLIINESLIYGGVGSIIGVTVGTLLSYLFFAGTRKVFMPGMIWRFPFITILCVFLVVAISCVTAALTSSRKIFKNSIVNAIRAIE
ncbi:ABC transporter permease [Clostridium sp. UBA6640]|uniref:ABC transporter permease n=1 Tax=Clostridium sp. UBA6640 TaxID=1946370 RepID=UPI0025BE316F|nr:FtsX-like permease family protein [Clostridium sp. UBA6640]